MWPVVSAVAWRVLKIVFTTPSLFFPSLVFPLFFFTAFAGGLSQVSKVPGFDFPPGYTAFQFCFVLIQSAAFGGVFTGFGIARDFEFGFARRLLLAAPNRTGIVLGYALAAVARWAVTAAVLTVVALLAGMNVFGGPVDVFGMYTLALVGRAVAEWTGGAEVVDLGAKFTSPVVVPAEGGAEVVVGGTVKSVADGLVTLALEVTCEGKKVLGMPKAVVREATVRA